MGELIILAGISLLFLEIIKASRSRRAGVDHALSMVLFVVALLEFLLVPACCTSGFLIITALALIDVIAGFAVSLSTARRDIASADRWTLSPAEEGRSRFPRGTAVITRLPPAPRSCPDRRP